MGSHHTDLSVATLIRSDILARYGFDGVIPPPTSLKGWRLKMLAWFFTPQQRAITCYRISHALHQHRLRPLALLLKWRALHNFACEIHPGAVIGEGMTITHTPGLVIGDGVVIGKFVRLHQGVILGVAGRGARVMLESPTVGDQVTIGAHAVIIGGIHVGDGAVIGANTVVTKDVPPGAVVVGQPGRILRYVTDLETPADSPESS